MTFFMPRADLRTVLRKLGQMSSILQIYDAGDDASYSTGQTWTDLSGNGIDLYRGSGSGSDAADPTFNGTAGRRSSSEYWSFDGVDYFTLTAANPARIENMHKNNATFTMLCWANPVNTTTNQSVFGNTQNVGNTGVHFVIANGGFCIARVMNAGSQELVAQNSGTPSYVAGAWQMFFWTMNEATGFGEIGWFGAASHSTSFTSTIPSPAAGGASFTTQICARGNAGTPFSSGSFFNCFASWEGRALTLDELRAIFHATRGKFGV